MNENKPGTPWVMYCDGAYCDDGATSLVVLMSPLGIKMRYVVRLDFEGKTNNVAKFEGLLLGLCTARAIGARRLVINTYSELITRQIGKTNKAKHDEMAKYLKTVRGMEKFFFGFMVKEIPRDQKNEADILAKAAT
jgi:ribonuclease HI